MRCQTFYFYFFPCSANHERDWPPCKVVFFGLATNALNVRNNNNNNVGAWVLLGESGSLEREGEGAKIDRKVYICILWTRTDEVWLPRREIKRGI